MEQFIAIVSLGSIVAVALWAAVSLYKRNRFLERELIYLKPWQDAVIDACIVSWIGYDEHDARGSLGKLICTEIEGALDPQISKAAADLRDTYKPKKVVKKKKVVRKK